MIEPKKNLDEMASLLKNAKSTDGQVLYLDGAGQFRDRSGNYISQFDILKQIYRLQNVVDRAQAYCSTLSVLQIK